MEDENLYIPTYETLFIYGRRVGYKDDTLCFTYNYQEYYVLCDGCVITKEEHELFNK